MNYRGTIAYRANLWGQVSETFLHSVVLAWDFLNREYYYPGQTTDVVKKNPNGFHFMRGLSCMPDESANAVAEQFVGDWVLMLDTDHVFGADAFYEMVTTFEDNQLDILVGFTQKRVPPYHPVLYKTNFDALIDFETIFPDPIERQMLIPIDASGAACLMVRRKVFEAIYFTGERPFDRRRKFEFLPDAHWRDLPDGRWKDETFGEDTSFFWRAQILGFKAYCAPWIKFHHIGTRLVTEDMIFRQPPLKTPS